jgi:hypothetical protein
MGVIEAVLYWIPLRLRNPVVIRQVFNLMQEDHRSCHVGFILTHKSLINIIEIQYYRGRLFNLIKFHHNFFCFIIKRVICLLNFLGFYPFATRRPYFNEWIRSSCLVTRWQRLSLVDVCSYLKCILAFWQGLFPRID